MHYNEEVSELLTISEIQPGELTGPQWHAIHALRVAVDLEELPDDQPIVLDEMKGEMLVGRAGSRTRYWAAWDGAVAAGFAWCYVDLNDNLHLAWSWVAVDPGQRRLGIGTRLLRAVADAAAAEERTVLGIDFRHATAGAAFAPAFGFEEKSIEHHNRTLVGSIDDKMIQSWIDRASERARGYTLRMWTAPTADDDVAAFARVFSVMNTAPRDDLDVGDVELTPELVRDREAELVPRGLEKWIMVAEAPDGTFAGFTEMFFSKWRGEIAHQGNTGVDPAFRNLGLGRWLKAAMYQRLRTERPEVEKIDTWNAGSNEPMLAINHAMGFAPINVWANAQASLSTVQDRLASAGR